MAADKPSAPSDIEKAHYYYGLPSEPVLVARSSLDRWVEPTGAEAYLVMKELKAVGPHPLNQVWESNIVPALMEYLNSKSVSWTTLDPIRIGKADDPSPPVIIWIGVIPDSLSATTGIEIALDSRAFLTANNINDVHVEIRESEATLSARLYKPVHTANPIASVLEPFATSLGLPICGGSSTTIQGTAGFYFTTSTFPNKLFFMTARHVLFHPDKVANTLIKHCNTSQPCEKVLLLGDAALEDHLKAIRSAIGGKEIILEHLEARMNDVEGEDGEEVEAEREEVQRLKREAENAKVELNSFLSDITRDWGAPADRTIGSVVVSPPLGFDIGPGGYTEDWVVVEVNSCINANNFVGNVIDLGTDISVDEFTSWMYPHPANPPSFKYPGNRLLRFFGTIPDNEMGKPPVKTLDHDNDPTIMVIKRGNTTGLTVGRLNSIRSVVRYYFDGMLGDRKLGDPTKEVAVLPRNSKSGAFSAPGDSGSVVVDGKGRYAGLLTGGAGATKVSDCTYVTSINFLVDRLARNGLGNVNLFPTAADI